MANANGNGSVWMLRVIALVVTILLAWLGILSTRSSTHATTTDLAAAEARGVDDVKELKADLTRQLDRIEDQVDRLVERD